MTAAKRALHLHQVRDGAHLLRPVRTQAGPRMKAARALLLGVGMLRWVRVDA